SCPRCTYGVGQFGGGGGGAGGADQGGGAAGGMFADGQLGGGAVAQLGHVADDAGPPAALAEAVQDVHDVVEGVLVEAAEPFVHEQGVQVDAAGLGGDHVG